MTDYDVIIRNGTIYDGSGLDPYVADVGIKGQWIKSIGRLEKNSTAREIDASGLVVSPGFINIMSWAPISLLYDGRSQSDIRQGVTLEVFGEGWSEGPINDVMRQEVIALQGDIKYEIPWNTLGEFLEYLAGRGVSTNIASFVGADTVRIYAMGFEDRSPTKDELDLMKKLVQEAMEEGAMGLSTALIYPPGCFTSTEEIIELAKVAAKYDGLYISHIRSEGECLLEAVDELIHIAREANIRSEIYHLKAMGEKNWWKMDKVISVVDKARSEGLRITADMYPYTAGATGLGATMPGWVQAGGHRAWIERLKDPTIRERLRNEMTMPSDKWENIYLNAGSAENILLVSFKSERLKPLTGKTLAEVAKMRGQSEIDTIFDLIIEDDSNIGTVYFTMTEDNLRKQIKVPWVCMGSDAPSLAPEGLFLKSSTHPRAYGTFARFLGKYVRDEGLIPLQEAIRRITSLPAETLRIKNRGRLEPGYYADIVIFDYSQVQDHATYIQPHQYSTGMVHVFVNGQQVLDNGEHTGRMSGQVVRGPGWKKDK